MKTLACGCTDQAPCADHSVRGDAAFTPEPWNLKPVDGLRGTEGYENRDLAIVGANGIVIGIVYEAGPTGVRRITEDDFDANARLISAAPALWAACDAMVRWDEAEKTALPYDDDHGKAFRERSRLCEEAFTKARAALALAEQAQEKK
jgi:hypothetical protein